MKCFEKKISQCILPLKVGQERGKLPKKTEYLDNKKSIPGEIKSIFYKFYGVSLAEIKQWT